MKSKIFVRLASVMMGLLFVCASYAQVTTGSISGAVTDAKGEPLAGATVKVTHVPSGSIYPSMTQSNGRYFIQGVHVGQDYSIEVSFIGFGTKKIDNITVSLGDAVKVDVSLDEESIQLSDIVIFGERNSSFNKERTGAATNISNREMNRLPNISRSLIDVTKLSPYSTGGSSFGGREAYMTNVTIDGANFNNNFGLSATSMPGVSGEPVSMDAIEELQVVIAPFDVRQSNFTGAGINAVTKRGTNEVKGTVYGFYRNQGLSGWKIREKELANIPETSKQTLGFSVGGPIIKNKLFFFLNGELDNNLTPGNTLRASTTGTATDDPNVSNSVKGTDLQAFSNLLKQKFGYNTGRYEDWGGDNTYNNKILARLDWNISNDHKLTVRYNFSKSSSVSRPSASGDANPAISPSRHSKTGGMSFENSQYYTDGLLHSATAELYSRFTNSLSNHFLAAFTYYDQPRTSDSDLFPMVDIMRGGAGDTNPYMTAGYELFSYGNRVQNNTLIITDNLTVSLDKHLLTAGLSYENQYFSNSYLRQGSGYYRFKDLASFERYINGEGSGLPYNSDYHPLNFAYTYPINGHTDPVAELSFGQFSAYVQDEWNASANFKLTLGLRVDLPIYLDGAIDNPLTKGLVFRNGETVDLGKWPTTKLLWSPRVGFNWNVYGDRKLTVRGGTGIFTGRIPFVWFTNQPTNSGMLQYQLVINQNDGAAAQSQLARIPFAADVSTLLQNTALADIFPQQNTASGRLAVIDKDFKLPQVWRTSVAVDVKLPLDIMLTLEGIYSKDINSIAFDNINIQGPDAKLKEGSLERDYFSNRPQRVVTGSFSDVIVMRNTTEGQSVSLSAQLRLPSWHGLSGDLAYTYNYAEEATGKNGSDPYSAWRYRQTLNTLNATEVGLTMNSTPHRFTAAINYYINYAKYFGTGISLFYNGYTGDSYSYTYAYASNVGSPVNDGGVGTYLAYFPKGENDVIWKDPKDWEAYKWFVLSDDYVKNHLGEYMQRYDAHLPWNSRWDLRFTQDFKLKAGNTTNTLQFTADIINFANLLNSNWGINKLLNGSNKAFPILRYEGRDNATGKAIVSMNKTGGEYYTSAWIDPSSTSATWALQLGLRYIFN
jgi:outer membrane receptor for ferrienterochelin and colicin